MYAHKPRLHELKILERLRKSHADAPEKVLAAEARHRFEAKVYADHKDGTPLVVLAKRYTYSVANVSRIVAAGRTAAEERIVSPLTVWQGRRTEQALQDVKAAYDAEQAAAPAPEDAFAFRPDESANDAIDRMKRAMDDHAQVLPEGRLFRATNGTLLTVPVGMTMIVRNPKPRVWHLIQKGNELSPVEPPVPAAPEPNAPTDADRTLFATLNDRGSLLGAAVRMLQLAAGIPATGDVDDATMSIVAGLAAWQDRSRPRLDDVESFMAERRRA